MAFLFGASIIISTLCLAVAVGRAVVLRPSFGLILLRSLQAALILVLLLIPIPVHTHREIFGGLVHHLVAYLAIVVSLTLPKDFASRSLKVIAVLASFGFLASSQLIGSGWVTSGFAGRVNRLGEWEVKSFARTVAENEVGPLARPIWADRHPDVTIREFARYKPAPPHHVLVPRWHTWFTGMYSYEEIPRRYRLSRNSSGSVIVEAVTLV